MGIVINRCVKCGHEWPQSTPTPPRRCPAAGCRTVKWKTVGKRMDEMLTAAFKTRKRK